MRQEWEHEELIASWTLVGSDWEMVANKAGATRLVFAVLLKFFELEGRFPDGPDEVPPTAVAYVAGLVGVDLATLGSYDWSGRAIKRHRVQIRQAFGFREWTVADEAEMSRWLAWEVCPAEPRPRRFD